MCGHVEELINRKCDHHAMFHTERASNVCTVIFSAIDDLVRTDVALWVLMNGFDLVPFRSLHFTVCDLNVTK